MDNRKWKLAQELFIEYVNIDDGVQVFVHNKLNRLDKIKLGGGIKSNQVKDDEHFKDTAIVLAHTDTGVVYRINNEIYFIPATIKAVVNNDDGKLNLWFDYPCEMKREDLVEY